MTAAVFGRPVLQTHDLFVQIDGRRRLSSCGVFFFLAPESPVVGPASRTRMSGEDLALGSRRTESDSSGDLHDSTVAGMVRPVKGLLRGPVGSPECGRVALKMVGEGYHLRKS